MSVQLRPRSTLRSISSAYRVALDASSYRAARSAGVGRYSAKQTARNRIAAGRTFIESSAKLVPQTLGQYRTSRSARVGRCIAPDLIACSGIPSTSGSCAPMKISLRASQRVPGRPSQIEARGARDSRRKTLDPLMMVRCVSAGPSVHPEIKGKKPHS
eukprot:2090633-Rhodomonas_salina.1